MAQVHRQVVRLEPLRKRIPLKSTRNKYFTDNTVASIRAARLLLLCSYLHFPDYKNLRPKLRSLGADYVVSKNMVIQHALRQSGFRDLRAMARMVRGPSLFIHQLPVDPSKPPAADDRLGLKLLKKIGQAVEKTKDLIVIGAAVDGKFIDRPSFLQLLKEVNAPDVSLAQTIASSPMYTFPRTLMTPAMTLSIMLNQRIEQLEKPTESEEAAVPA